MDATDRIVAEFDRLVTMGQGAVAKQSFGERVIYYVVATRCEIDIDGFASVYEQGLKPSELDILISGLRHLGEAELANEFHHGFKLLQADDFYSHLNWNKVSDSVKNQIAAIGERIGDQLWELDEKLAALLDEETKKEEKPGQL